MNKNILMVVLLIVGLGVGFFGGMQYQKSQASQRVGSAAGGQFSRRFGGAGGNGSGQAPVLGSVVSQDQNSITVKLQDGSTKLILLSGNTQVSKTDTGSASDLKVGDNVMVMGSTNSDGSVSAQNVMINPMFRGGGGARPQASSSPNQAGY